MTRMRRVRLVILLVGVVACGKESPTSITPEPGGTGGAESAGGAGVSGAAGLGGGAGAGACPKGLPGPELVALTAPKGEHYCIDRTEVTQGQYAEFLAAKEGDLSGMPKECSLQTTYDVIVRTGPGAYGCPAGVYDPVKKPKAAMECVTWCSAKMYCAWAGKHLCGRIGGGPSTAAAVADASTNEWFNACSQGGKTGYPYGDTYTKGTCNAESLHEMSAASCHGSVPPYDEIIDLSGNMAEWEDNCTGDGPGSDCHHRGGSYLDTSDGTQAPPDTGPSRHRCDADFVTVRGAMDEALGFRCCANVQ